MEMAELKSSSKLVKVCVVQAAPVILNVEATLEKVGKLCKEAGDAGAELVLFPEAFISCYPRGTHFGIEVGSRTDAGRELFRRYYDSSIEVPGPAVTKLGSFAAENKIHLVIGVIERDLGTLYCCVVFFDDAGKFLGKHRKVMPTAAERLIWGFGDGSTLPVFDTKFGKLGAVICWENYMPMLRMTMYSKGIEIYCAPTADCRETWLPSMRHIAMEGRCYVLTCNQFIRQSDYPASFELNEGFKSSDPNHILCRGGSCIINPLGEIISGPLYDEENILYATLDLNEITKAKLDFDPVGHYSRPDIFTLQVNQRSNSPVVIINSSPQPGTSTKE